MIVFQITTMQVLSVLTLASLAAAAPALKRAEPAALLKPQGEVVPNKYIVRMSDASDVSIAATTYQASHTYNSRGFKGFASELDDEALEAVRNDPSVEYVEHDQVVNALEYLSQENAPWGISRISHSTPGAGNYVYDSSAGEGACVYIIDTGIKIDHEEFEGRAEWVQNFTDDGHDGDGGGHGTWVAGLVASRSYGVAKKAKVLALKVFRDSGTTESSIVIAAIDFVAQDAATRDCPAGHVANLSLGGGYSQATNDATDAMVNAGVFVAVAAGNSNVDAGQTSPASAPLACTVGATTTDDGRASFSSYGPVVDVWAPGVNLESTSYEGGSTSASGTSGASPIVAGLGAYLMAFEGLAGGQDVCDRIKELAVAGALSGLPEGSANLLAYNGAPRRDNQRLAATYSPSDGEEL
ncbi:Cuticle-degrading protease-like protein [Paramyrothecium foliicola]|nr:Cuticle-degrading protease-like protein [Paramyrothecium foliicola]